MCEVLCIPLTVRLTLRSSDAAQLLQCKPLRVAAARVRDVHEAVTFLHICGTGVFGASLQGASTRTHLHKQVQEAAQNFGAIDGSPRRCGRLRVHSGLHGRSVSPHRALAKSRAAPGKSSSGLISALVHSRPLPSDSTPKPEPPLCTGSRRSLADSRSAPPLP